MHSKDRTINEYYKKPIIYYSINHFKNITSQLT